MSTIIKILNILKSEESLISVILRDTEFTKDEAISKLSAYKNQNRKFNISRKNIDGKVDGNLYIWN